MKYFCGFVSLPALQLTQPLVGVKTSLFLYGANEFPMLSRDGENLETLLSITVALLPLCTPLAVVSPRFHKGPSLGGPGSSFTEDVPCRPANN